MTVSGGEVLLSSNVLVLERGVTGRRLGSLISGFDMARILLVDDDEILREMLKISLERLGHTVVQAADGDEALRQCRAQAPDVVLTDLIMPGKEGLETIMELRKLLPKVPIIAMSGGGVNSPGGYLELAGRFGAVRVLSKPFGQPELAEAIRFALKGKDS